MTREEAIKTLEKAIQTYAQKQSGNLRPEQVAEIALTHCESVLNMIRVSPQNTFWDLFKGKLVDPEAEYWDKTPK